MGIYTCSLWATASTKAGTSPSSCRDVACTWSHGDRRMERLGPADPDTWWRGQKGKGEGGRTDLSANMQKLPAAWRDSRGRHSNDGRHHLFVVPGCLVLSIIYLSSYLFKLRGYVQTLQTGILEGKRKQGFRIHIRRHAVIDGCQLIWQ